MKKTDPATGVSGRAGRLLDEFQLNEIKEGLKEVE
jgi:hypothetical protein